MKVYLVTEAIVIDDPWAGRIYWKPKLLNVDEIFAIFWSGQWYQETTESTEEFKQWSKKGSADKYRIYNETYELVDE